MIDYKLRLIDEKIGKKLRSSGGILLKGVRYCGKTTTAEFHAASVVRFDASEQIRQQAALMPQIVLQGETLRLVDEWQLVPSIWNVENAYPFRRAAACKTQVAFCGYFHSCGGIAAVAQVAFARRRNLRSVF
jgi:hypothetical protein